MKKKLLLLFCLIYSIVLATACNGTGKKSDIIKLSSTVAETEQSGERFSFDSQLNSALVDLNSDNTESAIQKFTDLTKLYPNNAYTFYHLGRAYYAQSIYKQAVIAFKKALKLDPTLTTANLYLGYSLKKLNENNKASEYFGEYILKKPEDEINSKLKSEMNKLAVPAIGNGIIGRVFLTDTVNKSNNIALTPKSFFNENTEFIYASLELITPDRESSIQANWNYLINNKIINVNYSDFEAVGSKTALISIKKPVAGWPVGKYELEILVDNEKNLTLTFFVF